MLDLHPFLRGVLILLVTSCEGKRDKLQLDELPGLSKDFTWSRKGVETQGKLCFVSYIEIWINPCPSLLLSYHVQHHL